MRKPGLRLLLFLLLSVALVDVQGSDDRFELIGKIIWEHGKFTRKSPAAVLLEGISVPFAGKTLADLSGQFKFKKLKPGIYTLVVYIQAAGEYRQTVEVSPSLADSQKRIRLDVAFQSNYSNDDMYEVSTLELSIPESAKKEYEKARKKLGKNDYQGAITHLKKAVELAPQFIGAWNNLGTLAYQSGDFATAESYFREALKHDPDFYTATVNLGGALLSQSKFQDALPLNAAAVKERPNDALAQSQLGINYFYLGRTEEAEKHLKESKALDPGHFSHPQLLLAEIYLGRQDFASAAMELEQFLTLHPDDKKSPIVQKNLDYIRRMNDEP